MVTDDAHLTRVSETVARVHYASWTARVVAAVIDGFAFSGIVFLVAGPVITDTNIAIPLLALNDLDMSTIPDVARWSVVGVWLAFMLMQGLGGATLGKRVVGIAVVSRESGRPIGLLGSVLRWFAHLADVILLIGYLRPLWDAERRTFADSILGTVVLQTRTVRPNRFVERLLQRRRGLSSETLEERRTFGEPDSGPWGRTLTALATVLALLFAALAVSVQSSGGRTSTQCAFGDGTSSTFGPLSVSMRSEGGMRTERRLGIERSVSTPDGRIDADWEWAGEAPDGTSVELVATSADGAETRRTAFVPTGSVSDEWLDGDGPGLPGRGAGTVEIDGHDLASLGGSWTATTTISVDDDPVGSCTLSR